MERIIKGFLLAGAVIGVFYVPFSVSFPWSLLITPPLGYAAADLLVDLMYDIRWD